MDVCGKLERFGHAFDARPSHSALYGGGVALRGVWRDGQFHHGAWSPELREKRLRGRGCLALHDTCTTSIRVREHPKFGIWRDEENAHRTLESSL